MLTLPEGNFCPAASSVSKCRFIAKSAEEWRVLLKWRPTTIMDGVRRLEPKLGTLEKAIVQRKLTSWKFHFPYNVGPITFSW